ncbi:hypothetical protein MP228_002406 [Amoeboaphelidium protococcarum]|nr:hypothetical protein MP228_002406 [Amoeboaphelidium protococcarum]
MFRIPNAEEVDSRQNQQSSSRVLNQKSIDKGPATSTDVSHQLDAAPQSSSSAMRLAISERPDQLDAANNSRSIVDKSQQTQLQSQPRQNQQQLQQRQTVQVNPRQKGNPLIKALTVPFAFDQMMLTDYVPNATTGILFLSCKYHRLHPSYVYERVKEIPQNSFQLRVLILLVDIDDCTSVLREMTKLSIASNHTLMLSWSFEEAAQIISSYSTLYNKSADVLKGRVKEGEHLHNVLTSVKGLNKNDVLTLMARFGSFEALVNATEEELGLCVGFDRSAKLVLGTDKADNTIKISSTVVNEEKDYGHGEAQLKSGQQLWKCSTWPLIGWIKILEWRANQKFGPIALKQAGVVTTTVDTYVSAAKKTQTFTAKSEYMEQHYGRGLFSASIGSTLVSHGLLQSITQNEIKLKQSVVQQIRATPAASTPVKAGTFWSNKKQRVGRDQVLKSQSESSVQYSSSQQSSNRRVPPSSTSPSNNAAGSMNEQPSLEQSKSVQTEALDMVDDGKSPQASATEIITTQKSSRRKRRKIA